MLVQNLIYFGVSAGILITCGIYLVRSLGRIAKFLGISEFSAAFIIMAFATSIPELFVGLSSALNGNPALSLGNIIGANIIDLTLVTGLIVLMGNEITFTSQRVGKEVYTMLVAILLVIVLFTIGETLSRVDGAILIFYFFLHNASVFKKREKYKGKIKNEGQRERTARVVWIMIFFASLIGLFISSNLIVKASEQLAIDLKLPDIIIGLFLLSIATTLPELIFGISATKLEHKEMAIGDQVGTVVTNTALILGIVALIQPIHTEYLPFLISAVFMFISAFIFVTFIKSGNKLERYEGISLILIYVLFIIFEFFVKP